MNEGKSQNILLLYVEHVYNQFANNGGEIFCFDGEIIILLSSYMMVFFQRTRLCLQLLGEKFIMHVISGPYKHRIQESKVNYAHVILGPMECNQQAV